MAKLLDRVYKGSVWIIITLSLIAYFTYRVMSFDGSLSATLLDYQTYVQLLFVIFINVNMVSGAYDSGTTNGINSEEFNLADEVNNKIIQSVNNEMTDFRAYIKKLNQHELITLQEDYLFKVGDKKLDELTDDELKEYHKLKPIRHNIYGFNLPLYYELSKSHEVSYAASIKKDEGKRKKQIRKIFSAALYATMTINMMFAMDNVGAAFLSLVIISVGLILTFVMTYIPQVYKFKVELPKKVLLKNNLYNSFIAFKNGTHKLREIKNEEITHSYSNADAIELHPEQAKVTRQSSLLGEV